MSDYLLEIRYGETDAPVQLRLAGCTPEEAENKRQAIVRELEHALSMHAVPVALHDLDSDLPAGVTVDPGRVTDVELRSDDGA